MKIKSPGLQSWFGTHICGCIDLNPTPDTMPYYLLVLDKTWAGERGRDYREAGLEITADQRSAGNCF